MADLRVCVIGTGAMGTDHIIRINNRASGAIVTAIVEPDAARAAAALTHALDAKHFANISDAIASGLIDAALVATPGAFHEEDMRGIRGIRV